MGIGALSDRAANATVEPERHTRRPWGGRCPQEKPAKCAFAVTGLAVRATVDKSASLGDAVAASLTLWEGRPRGGLLFEFVRYPGD